MNLLTEPEDISPYDWRNQKCGHCRFWVKQPANALTLGQPARGECRQGPPGVTTLLVNGPPGQTATLASYGNLPEDFPACAKFEAVVL